MGMNRPKARNAFSKNLCKLVSGVHYFIMLFGLLHYFTFIPNDCFCYLLKLSVFPLKLLIAVTLTLNKVCPKSFTSLHILCPGFYF